VSDGDLLLAEGSRLLHIGPPKTGTTEIQTALHLLREELKAYGVVYPGWRQQAAAAALAITGARGPRGMSPKPKAEWTRLVREVTNAGDQRVAISSEFFATSDEATAALIVSQLGGERVHVAITLRPLALILPSAWQQFVRHGLRMRYAAWLRHMLDKPPYEVPTPTFWLRHRHDALIDRWAGVVGADHLTVIVADPADRRLQLRTFESMLGLPDGLLPTGQDPANRSLTGAEVEVIRQLNVEMKKSGWSDQMCRRVIRYGIVPALQSIPPLPDDSAIRTPEKWLQRAAEIGAEAADHIAASGVRVVGDISMLAWRPAPADPATPRGPRVVRPRVAAQSVIAALRAAEVQHDVAVSMPKQFTRPTKPPQPPPSFTTRVKRRLRRELRRLR
jgi:hypothetical protein